MNEYPEKVTTEEIYDLIGDVWDSEAKNNGGTAFRGMTYEDGIKAALDWVLGDAERPELS